MIVWRWLYIPFWKLKLDMVVESFESLLAEELSKEIKLKDLGKENS